MLFLLRFLSGLVAPYLIFQLRSLNEIVVILALAYLLGTFAINIAPEQRGELAIVLSLVALFASYFVVPIGAYEPKVIMQHNHLNPQEALEAFIDLKAKIFMPMHYGTFQLSDESINAPMKWLEDLQKSCSHEIYKIKIGEVKVI